MRGLLLILVSLFIGANATAQDRTFESTPITVINQGWKTKTIDNVINGSLGIMLERFDQT